MSSMSSSARSASKAKAARLTSCSTGKVDASGWKQPYESKTPMKRRAYAAGGKVGNAADETKFSAEIEKDAGCKTKRADKRPRKMDGGPTIGTGDPREFANNMMQGAANRAPVSGSNPIPTFSSPSLKKSPLRGGFEKGGGVKGPPKSVNNVMHPSVKKTVAVPKRIPIAGRDAVMPNTEYGPEAASKLKKGGRVGKGFGGALGLLPELMDGDKKKNGGRACKAGGGGMGSAQQPGIDNETARRMQDMLGSDFSSPKAADMTNENKRAAAEEGRTPKSNPYSSTGYKKGGRACKADGGPVHTDESQSDWKDKPKVDATKVDKEAVLKAGVPVFKKGGRAERKAGGRVGKGKTNINIIIAPSGGGEPAAAPQMGAPGMGKPPMMPPPPMPPAGGPPGAAGAGAPPPNPLAGLPPQLIAQAMGGGGGGPPGGASMPPSGPPRLPMRAAGGRLVREEFGGGSGMGRLEKSKQVAHMKKLGNHGV